MKHALFAGSFDPPTWGHLDIIERASKLFEKVSVGVAVNTTKSGALLPHSDRLDLLQELCAANPSVSIVPIPGLVVDFVKSEKVDVLIRSLRSSADIERETVMATANRQMAGVETLLLLSDPRYAHISSTLVREIAHFGGALEGFVPPQVARKIFEVKTQG
ncbi:MAG: pantetheine-phosphate adenylyltransferase [Parachlamydia sp.]|nr:pantetheine-phosphate adenylyltransferase [Parachlamydia sp.]